MTDYDVNVSTERLKEIEGIVTDAFDRMAQSAKTVGGQGEQIAVAYQGSGTETAMDTYSNLAGAGNALSEALEGLKDDLGLTGEHGHETDEAARQAMSGANGVSSQVTAGM
ncbi:MULTISPECIES: aliphatic sulfonate ABC transporter substrate-binding protein [unclassified Streptomyces]|uniref:aliphatic sulfonate ABC transporter substrate-binding protein n=1 Tax=unclassified Streptomyces TaxID=2593676 RepID=UPI0022B6ED68|nr:MULTISPECIES: aliphatic sulfonate ABC transporter substrate-binding protein [unclassified Streptomyces]MCZ7413901.1 aliphatic sulfonate ABC transporter substrate-binding protein [Streptomyces sp. WMMC897]MCZ7430897.1 aliphatic sulfonate ABC transporter substrate-binding protein [Streptomyces sp. WMMC1477]